VGFLQLKEEIEKTAKKVDDYKPYNILPFEAPGLVDPFRNSPEVGFSIQLMTLMWIELSLDIFMFCFPSSINV